MSLKTDQGQIEIKKARLILVISIAIFILIGFLIGYGFVWDKHETETQYGQEIKQSQAKIKKNPKDYNAKIDLGFQYMMAKDYNDSEKQFKDVLKYYPENNTAKMNLAYLYIETRRYKEADKLLKQVMKIEPGYQGYFLLGKSRYLQRNYKDAIQNLMSARDLEPTDTDVLYYLGLTFRKSGEEKKAVETFREALKYNPNNQKIKDELNFNK